MADDNAEFAKLIAQPEQDTYTWVLGVRDVGDLGVSFPQLLECHE